MAQPSSPTKTDPKLVKDAQTMWHNFTKGMTWSVIAVVGLLVLMALFLL